MFYDQVIGTRARHLANIANLIERYAPRALTLLELACGTGTVLKALRARYELAGLDNSKQMLAVARAKLGKKILLKKASMEDFDFKRRFDVIICVFDSINHLEKWGDWQRTFRNVSKHLSPGGVFIFDIHTDYGLERADWRTPWFREFGEGNFIMIDVKYTPPSRSKWVIKIFSRVGSANRRPLYQLWSDEVTEIAFPLKQVRNELRRHFRSVRVLDIEGHRVSSKSEKLHFVCKN